MGAIYGWQGRLDPTWLGRMHARLAHRGPLQVAGAAGECTLAAGQGKGRPPCFAARDALVLVLDGRIHGCSLLPEWQSGVDAAEHLLELHAPPGSAWLGALNGDFALAIADARDGSLLLARDGCGLKPLYYTRLAAGTIAFASEYKALVMLPGFDASVDREMLQLLQGEKHLPSDRTLLRAVRSVPPGTAVLIDRDGRERYATFAAEPSLELRREGEEEAARRIRATLQQAVARRCAGKQRFGMALSGGIDSIGIACALRQARPHDELHLFTAGAGDDDPEVQVAAQVAATLGAPHHVVHVGHASIEHLPDVIWHLEDPIARSEVVQFYEIGRAARGLVDCVVTGASADALYCGMPSHKLLKAYALAAPLRRGLQEFYSLSQTGRPPRAWSARVMERLYYGGTVPPVPRVTAARAQPALRELPPVGPEFLNEYLRADFREHAARSLPKYERMFAAWGLDTTTPFIDPLTVETAFTVPQSLKLRGLREKYILRRALRPLVPPALLDSPKFPARMRYDAEFGDRLDALLARYLTPERVARRGFFEPASIQAIRNYRRGGRYSGEGAMRAWTAVATELWAAQFLDGEAPHP